jgi:hypothetical protein
MKTKQLFIYVVFYFILYTGSNYILNAQERNSFEKISYSKLHKKSKFHYNVPVGNVDGAYYLLYKDYIRHGVLKIDSNLDPVANKLFKLDEKLRARTFCHLEVFFDTIYVFYSEKRMNESRLYVQKIDKNSLTQNDEEQLLLTKRNINDNYARFDFFKSPKHKKLLIVSTITSRLTKAIEFDISVYKGGLEKVWGKVSHVLYDRQAPIDFQYAVDDFGDVYQLSLKYEEPLISTVGSNPPLRNIYLLMSIINNGREQYVNELTIPYKSIRSPIISPGLDGGLACVGFYTEGSSVESRTGLFTAFIPPKSKSIVKLRRYDFSKDLMAKLFREDDKLYNFYSKFLKVRANGDFIFVAEQDLNYDLKPITKYLGNFNLVFEPNPKMQMYDNLNDVIICSINKFGELNWQNTINKRQSGLKGASLFLYAPIGQNEFSLFYNEHLKNDLGSLNYKNKKSFSISSLSKLVRAKVDEYGTITYSIVSKRFKKKLPVPYLKKGYEDLNGNFLLYSEIRGKYQFMKLSAIN